MIETFIPVGYLDETKDWDEKYKFAWTPISDVAFKKTGESNNNIYFTRWSPGEGVLREFIKLEYENPNDSLIEIEGLDNLVKNCTPISLENKNYSPQELAQKVYDQESNAFSHFVFELRSGEIIYGTTSQISATIAKIWPELKKEVENLEKEEDKLYALGDIFSAANAPLSQEWNRRHENSLKKGGEAMGDIVSTRAHLFPIHWIKEQVGNFKSIENEYKFWKCFNVYEGTAVFNSKLIQDLALSAFEVSPENIIPLEYQQKFMDIYQYEVVKSYIKLAKDSVESGGENQEWIFLQHKQKAKTMLKQYSAKQGII